MEDWRQPSHANHLTPAISIVQRQVRDASKGAHDRTAHDRAARAALMVKRAGRPRPSYTKLGACAGEKANTRQIPIFCRSCLPIAVRHARPVKSSPDAITPGAHFRFHRARGASSSIDGGGDGGPDFVGYQACAEGPGGRDCLNSSATSRIVLNLTPSRLRMWSTSRSSISRRWPRPMHCGCSVRM